MQDKIYNTNSHTGKGGLTKVPQFKTVLTSVARAFAILELLDEYDDGLLPKQISNKLKIKLTTCYHQLNTLLALGYIERNRTTAKFYLSNKIAYLEPGYRTADDAIQFMRPHLEDLQQTVNSPVYLSLWNGQEIFVGDIVTNSADEINGNLPKIGFREGAHATALGKAILGQLGEKLQRKYFEEKRLTQFTVNTIVDENQLVEHLLETAENGYGLDLEEHLNEIYCVAVPIFGVNNHVVASIGIGNQKQPFRKHFDKQLNSLLETSTSISQALQELSCAFISA